MISRRPLLRYRSCKVEVGRFPTVSLRACPPVSILIGVALLWSPMRTEAQSLLAAEGLGVVVEALDARSRAIGSAGIGLTGWYLLESDPAAAAGLAIPSANATFQPSTATLSDGATAGYTRFPAAGATYAYAGNVFSVQIASFLDQEWEVRATQTLDIGGQPVETEDVFRSTGSIGRVRVGWARIIGPVAVGLTVGGHIGTVERVFTRSLDPEHVGPAVEPFVTGGRLRASGTVVGAGVSWDPSPLFHVAGSVSWSDDLVLSPSTSSDDETGRYSLPLELRAGGTFSLTPEFALHLSTSYADWSDIGEDLSADDVTGSTWSYGGGLEWTGGTLFGRVAPLRIGARQRDLPFGVEADSAFERTFGGGLGVNLVEAQAQPLARLELGFERGTRESGTLSEDFWRVAVSVRVASG